MRYSTAFTHEYRDLIIGLLVLVLTVLVWAFASGMVLPIALAPAAI